MLAAVPFIVYLFATAPDYRRSLRVIIGVDNGSGAQVPGFVALLVVFVAGGASAWFARRPTTGRLLPVGLAALAGVMALVLAVTGIALPFADAMLANAVDPFTSNLVVRSVTPRQLTPEAAQAMAAITRLVLLGFAGFEAAALSLMLAGSAGLREAGRRALLAVNGAALAGLLLFAYIGFAAGIALTLRAALFAYGLALLLGMVWVGLLQLKASRRALAIGASVAAGLAIGAAVALLQTPDQYVVAGSLKGTVAVIKGTPSSLISELRLAQFPGAPAGDEIPVRTFADEVTALAALTDGKDVTAALIRQASAPRPLPVIWRTAALNDATLHRGIALLVIAIIVGLMCVAGAAHRRHPLAVTAEFVIDTIRGIPMLVIVLYVGLPLAGALKEASQGILDPPNFLRGIVAMGLAYSAYLAEITRAGVKAIPAGQFEAAASLGLTRWQTARLVVVPQAFRIILPALGNELIAIIKDTSLLSILSIRDITQRTREFQAASFLPFAPYNTAAIIYVILTLAAASLLATIERRYDLKQR